MFMKIFSKKKTWLFFIISFLLLENYLHAGDKHGDVFDGMRGDIAITAVTTVALFARRWRFKIPAILCLASLSYIENNTRDDKERAFFSLANIERNTIQTLDSLRLKFEKIRGLVKNTPFFSAIKEFKENFLSELKNK
jgi:hypothetical protein